MAVVERLRFAEVALDAGRASEGLLMLVIAVALLALTAALIVASPLTNPSRRADHPVAVGDQRGDPPGPNVLRLLGEVAVLSIVAGLRRLFRRR